MPKPMEIAASNQLPARAPEQAPNQAGLIFIVGASRSGTTLMSFILRRHPQVAGLKELQYFGEFYTPGDQTPTLPEGQLVKICAKLMARQDKGILNDLPETQHRQAAQAFVASLTPEQRRADRFFHTLVGHFAQAENKQIACEQTPRNIFYTEELLKLYPEARFVVLMRDPRAVLASQKKRWQRRQMSTDKTGVPLRASLRAWVNYHPFTIARLWNRAAQKALALAGEERVQIVRFEDLIEQPEDTIRSICAHCKIDFCESMLSVDQVNSSHQSNSNSGGGFNQGAISAWKQILSASETDVIRDRCGPHMSRHGYTEDGPVTHNAQPLAALRHSGSYLFHLAGVLLMNPKRAWIQFQGALRPNFKRGSDA